MLDRFFLTKAERRFCMSDMYILPPGMPGGHGLWTFFMNTGRALRLLFYGDCIDYREKKHGSKTCAIVALRNDTGTEPDDDRKHRY